MKRILFILLFPLFILSSCIEQGNGRLVVRMIDSPGDFQEVNIEINEISVNINGDWITAEAATGIYNLLELTGGAEAVLVDQEMPAGEITQIRLILGENNNVVIDGVEHPLNTPSAQQSGIKLKINSSIEEGITYSLLLDFDAARSIVKTGNGKFNLKPVIRTVVEATTGALKGKVFPASESVAVYAKVQGNAFATSYAVEDNEDWILTGLEESTYTIEFDPGDDSIYKSAIIENVEVKTGVVRDIGEITLELK